MLARSEMVRDGGDCREPIAAIGMGMSLEGLIVFYGIGFVCAMGGTSL